MEDETRLSLRPAKMNRYAHDLIFSTLNERDPEESTYHTVVPAGLALPVYHLASSEALLPSCAFVLTVCSRCPEDAWPVQGTCHGHKQDPQVQAGWHTRI